MHDALSSDTDLNDIFKSSRLSALKDAGEVEQLARLKERVKNACKETLGIVSF